MLTSEKASSSVISEGRLSMESFETESARRGRQLADLYHRYHIDTEEVDDVQSLPIRFLVEKLQLY